jgi:hypothetical protein
MDSYQWYQSGNIISGAITSSYSAAQAGTYIVVVSKSGCSTTSSGFAVSSQALPTITTSPTGAVKIASTATQTINASTGTGFSYRWFKDNVVITGATSSSYTTGTAGAYKVEATQNGCINTSATLTLTKNIAPLITVSQNQSLTYQAGMTVTLSGSASDADGSITSYLWSKVSGPSVTMSGTTTNTLVLSNLTIGTYSFQLRATDNFGESTNSSNISVSINQGTNDYNYISTSVVLVPGITNPSSVETLTIDQRSKTYQYFDGLGRPMQSVTMQGSPAKLDIVQPIVYDSYGGQQVLTLHRRDEWMV